MVPLWLFTASFVGVLLPDGAVTGSILRCAHFNRSTPLHHPDISMTLTSDGIPVVKNHITVQCQNENHFCYTTWNRNASTGQIVSFSQGCMSGQKMSQSCLHNRYCASKLDTITDFKICCCHGHTCNNYFSEAQFEIGKRENQMLSDQAQKPSIKEKTASPVDTEEYTYCAYYDVDTNQRTAASKNSSLTINDFPSNTFTDELVLQDGKTVRCSKKDSCYTLWFGATNETEAIINRQGCWRTSCEMEECFSNQPIKILDKKDYKFCCCRGDMCNTNFTDIYDPNLHTTPDPMLPSAHLLDSETYQLYRQKTIIISMVSVCSVALITIGLFLLYKLFPGTRKPPSDLLTEVEAPQPSGLDLSTLKLCNQICHGRYGDVWSGFMGETPVGVKIYSSNHKQIYLSEKSIYTLPFFEHENLLKFYGGDEQVVDGTTQYMLILSYIPLGALQGYLKTNTVDWATFCKMCLTIAKGLTHLHSDIRKGDLFKPSIAHRDINTRNILVNCDLSCVIADFGFGITMMGSKIIRNGHYENAEHSSLQDVGTLRYMAPELLDGAANLRESESSLKQIDMYAFGLVMWEISSRCTDLFQGVPTPEYMLPFQKEAGNHPSFEEMQILVSRNKVRPKFPEVWKDYNQAIRALKETIEDCWDHDAEARLTAMCVEERISDLMTLWSQDSKHKGMTPTITTTSNLFEPISTDTTDLKVDGQCHLANGHVNTTTLREQIPNTQSDSSTAHLLVSSPPNSYVSSDVVSQRPLSWRQDWGMSSSTTDTILSPSEGEISLPPQKLMNVAMDKNKSVLRPHQGRNPTVERNTHKRSDEELAVSGNQLVYGVDNRLVETAQNAPSNIATDDTSFDGFSDNLETSLVQNDVLNHHRSHPISYVQNQVHGDNHPVRPKIANLPGTNPQPGGSRGSEPKPHRSKLSKLMSARELGSKLGQLSLLSKIVTRSSDKKETDRDSARNSKENMSHINGNFDNSSVCASSSSRSNTNRPSSLSSNSSKSYGHTDHSNVNLNQAVPTEVQMRNGNPVVRPLNLNISHSDETHSGRSSRNSTQLESRLGMAEIGVAKLEMVPQRAHQSIVKIRKGPYSKSTSDLSPQKTNKSKRWSETGFGEEEEDGKEDRVQTFKRPDSLSLKGHNYTSQKHLGESKTCSDLNLLTESSKKADCNVVTLIEPKAKIKRRIKTPLSLKHGRFSLYDDRLMTKYFMEHPEILQNKVCKSSASLQELVLLDRNANSFATADHNC
ncbi:bone morphogenetic protein receptor type-2-like [Ylistrum balloti]|uniref:bone morphogenetic protein receptor type-2-like n=1 Tax=Ylistrum balloti TaxID=509963 RepID=UPI0029058EF2|nr:bone morphogenetic protein receptor type-2-like [Ylistrum balloti]